MSIGNSSWGVTESQLDDIVRNYGGRVVVKRDDSHRPSPGVVIQYNRKRATVRICGTDNLVLRVTHSHLKPPADFRYILERTPMPPDNAPRPNKVSANEPAGGLSNQIVVVAARLEQKAVHLDEARKEFEKIERDFVAMKSLRDEAKADLDKQEMECREIQKMLSAATARLLSGNMAGT